jgi:hypothetical protein
MEAHINDVESRLQRREIELTTQLDNARMDIKLERGRMKAQHDAELLEKDEQLLRFQTELEHLVQLFRANNQSSHTTILRD